MERLCPQRKQEKICRQAVLAAFTFFLLLWKLLVRLSMVPCLRSPLSLDALLGEKMDYWSISGKEGSEKEHHPEGAVGDLLFVFSPGRKVSHLYSSQISFLRNLEPAMLCTQHLPAKSWAFEIPAFPKQMHIFTQQACLCTHHPQLCLQKHKMLHSLGTEREIQLRLQLRQIFHLTTDLSPALRSLGLSGDIYDPKFSLPDDIFPSETNPDSPPAAENCCQTSHGHPLSSLSFFGDAGFGFCWVWGEPG